MNKTRSSGGKTYTCYSNGDFNDIDSEYIDWEMSIGGQRWAVVTRRELTGDEFSKVTDFMDELTKEKP